MADNSFCDVPVSLSGNPIHLKMIPLQCSKSPLLRNSCGLTFTLNKKLLSLVKNINSIECHDPRGDQNMAQSRSEL